MTKDLFADNPPQRQQMDLFADNPPQRQQMDLFADNPPQRQQMDLFADGAQGPTINDRAAQITKELIRRGVLPPEPEMMATHDAPSGVMDTAGDVAAGITRGAGPYAVGALAGAGVGSLAGGVGAIPGAIAGTGAVAGAKFIGDPTVDFINQQFGTKYTRPTDALNDLFTRLGVPEPETTAGRVAEQIAEGAAGAGGMAAAGKLIQQAAGPVTAGVGRVLAAQPAQQVAGGAAGAGAAQVAEEAGVGEVGQAVAGLAGGIAGAGTAGLRGGIRRLPSEAAEDVETAAGEGVRLMTSDVRPPQTFFGKWTQATGEKIPLAGTGGVRQAQQKERVQAIENVLQDFGADEALRSTDKVMFDLAKKRSSDLNKYSKMKGRVISDISEEATEPVGVSRTIGEIDNQIARLERIGTEDVNPVIAKLNDWKANIQGKDLSVIESIRKSMGEAFKSPELSASRSEGEKALSAIYGPMRDDMGAYISEFGKRRDFDKWNLANRRLSEMAEELDMTAFKSVLRKGTATPEEINKLLFSKKPSEVRQLYRSLTPEGRANARAAILEKVASKSRTEGGYSPERFVNELERQSNSVGVFFSGNDLKRVEGLARVINMTRRAGQADVAPPTGVQVAIPAMAGILTDMLGSFGAATLTGGGVGLVSRVYESKPVRDLLINISRTKVGTKEEAALAKRLISTIQTQLEQTQESE